MSHRWARGLAILGVLLDIGLVATFAYQAGTMHPVGVPPMPQGMSYGGYGHFGGRHWGGPMVPGGSRWGRPSWGGRGEMLDQRPLRARSG